MRRYAAGHDPLDFVVYLGDEFNYDKQVFSVAEQDALLAALLEHLRRNGRDVVVHERMQEEAPDA
jgi:hypothetical protein